MGHFSMFQDEDWIPFFAYQDSIHISNIECTHRILSVTWGPSFQTCTLLEFQMQIQTSDKTPNHRSHSENAWNHPLHKKWNAKPPNGKWTNHDPDHVVQDEAN